MATPKRLNFSSSGDGDESDTSLQKPPSTHGGEEISTKKKKKKKKKKLASPAIKRIWNEDDELSILKGLVDYRVKTRHDPNFDWDGFFDFVQGSINVKFSKEQLFSKIRKLRRKFIVHMERINRGNDPLFTRCTDSQAFGYSNMIWGINESEVAAKGGMEKAQEETQSREDEQMDNAEHVNDNGAERSKFDGKLLLDKTMEYMIAGKEAEFANGGMENVMQIESCEDAFKENGRVANDEPVNENGAEKGEFDGKSLYEVGVDTTTEYKTDGKESHDDDDDDDDDELCVVEDAFETMILQGLSGCQKKLQLNKLMMNLGTGKRKELSNEWKELCSEEVKLNIKKLRFAAKLVEAANDG